MSRVLASLVLMVPAFLSAQSDAEQAIREILHDQVAAWNNGDIEAYMKGYWNSEETKFVSGGNVLTGYKKVLERYRQNYGSKEKMGMLRFDHLEVSLLSDETAMATGVWELQRTADRPWGRFTLILRKKSEGWRITYDHTSSAAAE